MFEDHNLVLHHMDSDTMGLKTLALPSILGVYHDKTLRWFISMRTQSLFREFNLNFYGVYFTKAIKLMVYKQVRNPLRFLVKSVLFSLLHSSRGAKEAEAGRRGESHPLCLSL